MPDFYYDYLRDTKNYGNLGPAQGDIDLFGLYTNKADKERQANDWFPKFFQDMYNRQMKDVQSYDPKNELSTMNLMNRQPMLTNMANNNASKYFASTGLGKGVSSVLSGITGNIAKGASDKAIGGNIYDLYTQNQQYGNFLTNYYNRNILPALGAFQTGVTQLT